eukprot:TRINITY_DN1246_c0_g4_i2.p1 TRINITY_DN1246_c0_g4~~TRINITY_DN1246_c0_g4_i2.p1  ORF type:complete len:253 (-),score=69.72 TRINITY_DN1246_c0_g4_i2:81-839(-)
MPGRLTGKVAIVTASTQGIGYAIAEKYAEEGAHVVISSRKQKNVDEAVEKLTKKGYSVIGAVCHVSDQKQREALIQTTIEKWGKIDILVNNAASNPSFGSILDANGSVFDKIMDVNVKAGLLMSIEVSKHMAEKESGSIIFVASIAGLKPMPGLGIYCVSKSAMIGLSNVLAAELAASKIRVNCIAPGIIKTKFSELLWTDPGISEEMLGRIPLKKFGEPEDIAPLAVFLASDESSYITGETIVASGGLSRL